MKGKIHKNKGKGSPYIVRFGKVFKRFRTLETAEWFLTGLRFKEDEGIFDPRDYRRDNPLGFGNLATKWLDMRHEAKSYPAMRNHMGYAIAYWGQKNVKEIQYAELEDFFTRNPAISHLSGKTLWNIKTTLHSFQLWVTKRYRRERIPIQMPEFPHIDYELRFRKTINLDLQDELLDDIKAHAPYRAWLAIYLLSTYPKIRPGELRSIKEKDIDLDLGLIRIRRAKGPKPTSKEIKLLPEDVSLFKGGFPEQFFCRHGSSGHGKRMGQRWGVNYLNKVWKAACDRLGVKGVSLYPGTKHSTVRGLRHYLRPDEIKKGTGIASNSAFERYFSTEYEDELKLYEARARLRGKVRSIKEGG